MPEDVVKTETTPAPEVGATPPEPEKTPPVEKPSEEKPSEKLEPGHPRFDEVYGKWKAAERKNEALERDFKVAGDHNQELSNAINNLNTNLVDARTADSSKVIDEKIAILEKEFSATITDDPTKAQEIANKLMALKVDQGVDQRLAEVKAEPPKPESITSVKDARQQGEMFALYQLVMAENPWLLEKVPELVLSLV